MDFESSSTEEPPSGLPPGIVKVKLSNNLKRIKSQMKVRVRPKDPTFVNVNSGGRISDGITSGDASPPIVYTNVQKSEGINDDFYFHMAISAISVFVALALLSLIILFIFARRVKR